MKWLHKMVETPVGCFISAVIVGVSTGVIAGAVVSHFVFG